MLTSPLIDLSWKLHKVTRQSEKQTHLHNKCPFCQRKYSQSGTYEKHLQNLRGNLDIVLASTLQYGSTVINHDN